MLVMYTSLVHVTHLKSSLPSVMELHAKKSHTINAECAGVLSWCRIQHTPISTKFGHTRHTIFQRLQDFHVENCIDSLVVRYKFVVHNSMAGKKLSLLWLLLCSPMLHLVLAHLFPLLALRLQHNFVFVYPSFVAGDDPLKHSSLLSEVFKSMQWSFYCNFCSGVGSFATIMV